MKYVYYMNAGRTAVERSDASLVSGGHVSSTFKVAKQRLIKVNEEMVRVYAKWLSESKTRLEQTKKLRKAVTR